MNENCVPTVEGNDTLSLIGNYEITNLSHDILFQGVFNFRLLNLTALCMTDRLLFDFCHCLHVRRLANVFELLSVEMRFKAPAKSVDTGQPARTAQSDLSRYILL